MGGCEADDRWGRACGSHAPLVGVVEKVCEITHLTGCYGFLRASCGHTLSDHYILLVHTKCVKLPFRCNKLGICHAVFLRSLRYGTTSQERHDPNCFCGENKHVSL